MLPIVKIPQVVEHFSPYFKDLFSCSEYEQFQRYLSGLIISENKTVEGMNRHFVVQVKDQSTLNRFLTRSSFDWKALNKRRLDYLQAKEVTSFKSNGPIKGVLGIDDTLMAHYGSHFDDITKLKDPHSGTVMWSHNLVTLYYSDDKIDYPVYQHVWEPPDIEKLEQKMDDLGIHLNKDKRAVKEEQSKKWRYYIADRYRDKQYKYPELVEVYKTKLWLARDLVESFIEQYPRTNLPFCFDRWYTKPMLCNYITSKHRAYVGLLESKTKISVGPKEELTVLQFAENLKQEHLKEDTPAKFHKVGVHWREKTTHYYAYCKTHHLPAFGKVRLVISYKQSDLSDKNPYILISNQFNWRAAGILSVYRRRWPVEVFYEEAKAEGLNKYQIRQDKAIRKHITLVSVVYSLLHAARYDQSLISKLQQQLLVSVEGLIEGSVAHWRRVVKAQTFLNLVEWIANSDQDSKNWKLIIMPIIQAMTY